MHTSPTQVPGSPLTQKQLSQVASFCDQFSRCYYRFTHQTDASAYAARQFGIPSQVSRLGKSKDHTQVVFFHTYANPVNKLLQPTKTLFMVDIDQDIALDKLGCVNHLQLRDTAREIIRAKNLPALVFASASGKTKVAVAVRLGGGDNMVKLSNDERKEVLYAILDEMGWGVLQSGGIDVSAAGMGAFALTQSVGLDSTEEEVKAAMSAKALNMAPVLNEYRESTIKEYKGRFELSPVTRMQFFNLKDIHFDILEFMMASAYAHQDRKVFALSQACIAKTLDVSVATVSRAFGVLAIRGILKQVSVGNNYNHKCSEYTLSPKLQAILDARIETDRVKALRNQIDRIYKGVTGEVPTEYNIDAALSWLNTHKPLVEGSRFANTPAWVAMLRKSNVPFATIVEIIMQNDNGEVPEERSEIERRVRWLFRNDAKIAS